MAETKKPKEPRYLKEALFLAESYTKMLEEREWLKKRIAGNWTYTKEMAIAELDSITVAYDNERVQSSNISNPTERIALKLTEEYMARKQAEMNAERDACIADLKYLDWKIGVVETVWKERMKEKQSAVFQLIYIGNKTFKEAEAILRKKKKINLVNRNISEIKEQIWSLFETELFFRERFDQGNGFLKLLSSGVEG